MYFHVGGVNRIQNFRKSAARTSAETHCSECVPAFLLCASLWETCPYSLQFQRLLEKVVHLYGLRVANYSTLRTGNPGDFPPGSGRLSFLHWPEMGLESSDHTVSKSRGGLR